MMLRTVMLAGLVSSAFSSASAQAGQSLEVIAREAFERERIVGASVLVEHRGKVILHQGYGAAELGLEVATRPETVFHVVGPMLPLTGVAVMQLVEAGLVGLDDGIDKFIPEFPLQGRHVTIRQLLAHTSGVVDYHYLGDPIEATSRIPKGLDEVMALYAGKAWVNEPGTKWDWSISGFQLLVTVVERVTKRPFADQVRDRIFAPAGVTSSSYCDDHTIVKGLSHAYRRYDAGFVEARDNDMSYNADLRFCSTVGDLNRIWRTLRAGKLLKPASFTLMATPEGPGARQNPKDSLAQYGLALSLNHEDGHRRVGQHGSLFGYSGSLYEFPAESLTVVVLSNTEGQNAYAIARAISRAVLHLPALPASVPSSRRTLADGAIDAAEMRRLQGTYLLKVEQLSPDQHDSYAQYVRTFRVFDENGRLLIQRLGEGPERLLKQPDGSFAIRSAPRSRLTFAGDGPNPTRLAIDPQGGGLRLGGARIGNGDPTTFHGPSR